MECPVCKAMIGEDDLMLCPECHTDMEIFTTLKRFEHNAWRHKVWIRVLGVLLFIFMVGALSVYWFLINPNTSNQSVINELVYQQQETILKLEQEKQSLVAGSLELGRQLDSLMSQVQMMSTAAEKTETKTSATATNAANLTKPPQGDIIHIVKKGESLFLLAIRYYGHKDEYLRIMKDNGIKNPDHIWIGQRLKIKDAKINN
ncbi:MAG: LysM peptidoglycan-binding domain-containing protein [Bacteroidales bacterium]|nr:LysM peptidoglycan-binding domain-containing protein [Bacteroidales bacterium]